jgi:hypothetical protein
MYITNQAQQQVTESTQQACISKQLHRTKSVSLAQLIMAKWSVTVAREEKVGEEEKHTHQTPRRMPGRHGGAVPARSARGYLGMSSPSTPGAPHLGASTGVYTHHDHLGVAQQAPGENLARHRARRRPESAEPEQDPATDLFGEEAVDESSWRRG